MILMLKRVNYTEGPCSLVVLQFGSLIFKNYSEGSILCKRITLEVPKMDGR